MSTLTVTKTIPDSSFKKYAEIGWKFKTSGDGYTFVTKQLTTGFERDKTECIRTKNLYLLQRGEIKSNKESETLTESVSMDYMGSSEFEFGALPTSLRCVESQFPLYSLIEDSTITALIDGEISPLYIYAVFDSDDQVFNYLNELKDVFLGKKRLKEGLRVESNGTYPVPGVQSLGA